MSKTLRCILAYAALVSVCGQSIASNAKVMAWGVKPSDDTPAFITQIRLGCPSSPAYCVNKLDAYRNTRIRKASLAMHWKSVTAEMIIKQVEAYINLIAERKDIDIDTELSIDDFGSFAKKFGNDLTLEVFNTLASRNSSQNRPYTIGITLYEDELELIASDKMLLRSIAKVDRIALFLHHRTSQRNLENYIRITKEIAPNSEIYLGIYHYDRSDYIACTKEAPKNCSETQEIYEFKEALRTQLEKIRKNKVDGLELYPGHFGNVAIWAGWKNPRICAPHRINNCTEISREMSTILIQEIINLHQEKRINR